MKGCRLIVLAPGYPPVRQLLDDERPSADVMAELAPYLRACADRAGRVAVYLERDGLLSMVGQMRRAPCG